MGDIIEFIKELLTGKKMDAKWIVTIAIAVAGLAWSGTLLWQEYQGMQGRLSALEGKPGYNDKWAKDGIEDLRKAGLQAIELSSTLKTKVIKLEELSIQHSDSVTKLNDDLHNKITKVDDNLRKTVNDTRNNLKEIAKKLATIETKVKDSKLGDIIRKVERMEEKLNRAIKDIDDLGDDDNPLSM